MAFVTMDCAGFMEFPAMSGSVNWLCDDFAFAFSTASEGSRLND